MSIRLWPEQERPRERLLEQGAQVLSDAELLAIFLRTGTSKQSAVEMARQLLQRFGGIASLMQAPVAQVLACHGMGEAKYAQLLAALELGRRYLESELKQGEGLDHPQKVKQYIHQQLRQESREVFAVVFLDSQLKLLAFEKLFLGSLTQCAVYIREILQRALAHRAIQLIVCHNHPDAPATPSAADLLLTQQLYQACELVDIHLVDHVIVGNDGVRSLAELGQMPN